LPRDAGRELPPPPLDAGAEWERGAELECGWIARERAPLELVPRERMAAELDRRSFGRIRGPVEVALDPVRAAPGRDICVLATSRAVYDGRLLIARV